MWYLIIQYSTAMKKQYSYFCRIC